MRKFGHRYVDVREVNNGSRWQEPEEPLGMEKRMVEEGVICE